MRLTPAQHAELKERARMEGKSLKAYTEELLNAYAETPYPLADRDAQKVIKTRLPENALNLIKKEAKRADLTVAHATRQIVMKQGDGEP